MHIREYQNTLVSSVPHHVYSLRSHGSGNTDSLPLSDLHTPLGVLPLDVLLLLVLLEPHGHELRSYLCYLALLDT